MAALSQGDRIAIAADVMRAHSESWRESGLVKVDVFALVAAVDNWTDANAPGFVAALPEPAASTLTLAEKIDVFRRVVIKRYLEGA